MEELSTSLDSQLLGDLKKDLLLMKQNLERFQQMYIQLLDQNQKLLKQVVNSETRYKTPAPSSRSFWVSRTLLPPDKIPRFIPMTRRPVGVNNVSTRFLSFVNFKGGVGKTTLTSNLAAAFAFGNYNNGSHPKLRVLVVDIDFQGTLSARCVDGMSYQVKLSEKKTSAELLTSPSLSKFKFQDLPAPFINIPSAEVIVANEFLSDKDDELFLALANNRTESRFYYRLWFQKEEIFNKYDLVIFDCPPRITASSVCAFATSDYIFLPSAPENFDTQAVARTLGWLHILKERLDLSLQIGGVILNRTQKEPSLTPNEKKQVTIIENSFRSFEQNGRDVKFVSQKSNVLKTFIPKRTGSNHISGENGTALQGASIDLFRNLATEIYERIY